MKLGEYIHELIKENETVIIPGFGAFVSNYKPAEIEENEIKPPSKEITFTEQIRNNDGLLVGQIADSEKISHFDALKRIEKERENIIFLLDKGEKVTLEETGILFYNEKNEIQFDSFHDENLLLDSFGLEPVSMSETSVEPEEKVEVPVIEIPQNENKEEESTENKEPEETKDNTVPIEAATEDDKNEENESEVGENSAITEPEKPDEEIEKTEEKETIPAEEPEEILQKEPVILSENETEEKKKRGGWWYLLILIPIIIAGIFVIKSRSGTEKSEPQKSEQISNPIEQALENRSEIIQIDSAKTEITEEQKIDSIETEPTKTETQFIPQPGSGKFYLVGGGFKEEKNAETYLLELKEKGLNPFHLGKRGNFYLVAVGKYETEAEAVRAKREYTENNPGSGTWIMEDK